MSNDLREKIILATIELGAERGIENLTIRDIAKICGVSNPAMYYHFKNKYELLYEAILHITKKGTRVVHRTTKKKNTFKENYLAMMKAIARHSCANQKDLIFYNRVRVIPTMELTQEDHMRLRQECGVSQLLSEGVRDGILIGVDNIVTLAYYPLTTFLFHHFLAKTVPKEAELDRIIIGLWRSIAAEDAA